MTENVLGISRTGPFPPVTGTLLLAQPPGLLWAYSVRRPLLRAALGAVHTVPVAAAGGGGGVGRAHVAEMREFACH